MNNPLVYFLIRSKHTILLTVLASCFLSVNQGLCATKLSKENNRTFDIAQATISSIQSSISTHQITCETLVNYYLHTIKKHDLDTSRRAAINAFVNINPSLLNEAKRLDHHFKTTKKLIGPLHCVPTIVKDNIDS